MNHQQNSLANGETWVAQLLSLETNKSSLDQFMLNLLEANKNLCDITTETLEESFLRIFIFGMKEKEGVFNPTYELLYRVKYLTLIHPSPYSQFLLARIIHYRALYMANKNQHQEIDFDVFRKSTDNSDQKKKYFQYSHQIDKTYENEIKRNKGDSEYLEKIKNFSAELKMKINSLKAHENNFFASLYLVLKFGEYLKDKFPNTSLEKIKEEVSVYSNDFNDEFMPSMMSMHLAEYACHKLTYGEHEPGLLVLNDLRAGYEGFFTLLQKNEIHAQVISHPNEDIVEATLKYVETDLIPNTPSRIDFDLALNDLSTHLNLQGADKKIIHSTIRRFTRVADNYFINPTKDPKLKIRLKDSIDVLINDVINSQVSSDSFSLQVVIGNFKLALLSIFWINPLLNLSLTKKSVDEYLTNLSNQAALIQSDSEDMSVSPFSYLFLKDLKDYGDMFNPSDALLYRVKYLTLINRSQLFELLCSEVMRCRTLFIINQKLEIKLTPNKIFSSRDFALHAEYVKVFNLVNATIEKEIRLSLTDSLYLDHVRNISDELDSCINSLEQNQNLFDVFSIFIDFGMLLKEKYTGKTEREILHELKIHAFDYIDYKKPNLLPFALAKRSLLALSYSEYELEVENSVNAAFYAGLKGVITLLGLDENEIEAVEIHSSPNSLIAKAEYFITGDLIPNALPKRELFSCIKSVEAYAEEFSHENNKEAILQYVSGMKEASNEYFLFPVKNTQVIQKFKRLFDDLIIKMSDLTDENLVVNLQWKGLIRRTTHAVVKVIDVGMNAITKAIVLNNKKNYATFFANSAQYEEGSGLQPISNVSNDFKIG